MQLTKWSIKLKHYLILFFRTFKTDIKRSRIQRLVAFKTCTVIFPSLNQVLIKPICLTKVKLDIKTHIPAVFESEARQTRTRIKLCLGHHLSYEWILCLHHFNCKNRSSKFFKLRTFAKLRTCKYLLNLEIIKMNTRKISNFFLTHRNRYSRIMVRNTPEFNRPLHVTYSIFCKQC